MTPDFKVVSFAELKEDNPTFCLSAIRQFKKCHHCDRFRQVWKKKGELQATIKALGCNPQLTPDTITAFENLPKLKAEVRRLQAQIRLMEGDPL